MIGASGRFFARVPDTNPKVMTEIFLEAEKHQGTSVVEIMQNCVIFNDKVFAEYTDKEVRADNILHVEQGKPMIFGKESNQGLVLNGFKLEQVTIGENGITEADILVHDAREEDSTLHMMLAKLQMPIVTGVVRDVPDATFDMRMQRQIEETEQSSKFKSVNDLFNSGETWEIE